MCQIGTLNKGARLGVTQLLRDDYCLRSQFATLNTMANIKKEQVKSCMVSGSERSKSQIVTLKKIDKMRSQIATALFCEGMRYQIGTALK
jgi:hypothetical protein